MSPTSEVMAEVSLALPIRNPCELRGLYRRSYFGPRTCDGGITNVIEVTRALKRESVLFIGTQFSILYTFMYSPA